jgi:hypothetical protein
MQRRVLLAALALGGQLATASWAQTKCAGDVVLAGKKVTMSHCAVAYFDDQHSITVWFDAQPIAADKSDAFALSSYASEPGRQMLLLSFCPAGAGKVPDAKAVPSVSLDVADGPSWVFELAKEKDWKVERVAGKLAPGGRLAAHVTGKHLSDGKPYSFDLDFDLPLPAKSAAAGTDCGAKE